MTLLRLLHLLSLISVSLAIVGYWPFTKWPKGKFSLPSTRSEGCPASNDFAFEHGKRIFDCDDDNPISDTSIEVHLDMTVDSEKDIHLSFCSKTVELNDESLTGGDWPSGRYCFFRVGGNCPSGFHEGWILWQDERSNNRNGEEGILPDGVYHTRSQTTMFFCCRTDGDPDVMIELPRARSFVMLKHGEKCQAVEGTRYQEEFVLWDNDRRDPGQETHSGVIPEMGVDFNGDVRLVFCYYSKIPYCGNPGVPEHGEVDSTRYTMGSTLRFSCDQGYRLSGLEEITCITDEKWSAEIPACKEIRNCEDNNGGCDQECIDMEAGKHRCECKRGYELLADNSSCMDINECADPETADQCQHLCVNENAEQGSWRCKCEPGYILNPDKRTCRDEDECTERSESPCQQKCSNYEGGYSCSCYSGFSVGSPPSNCDDVNECNTNPCEHVCNNLEGSYQCGCIAGFELMADNKTCHNTNPCDSKFTECAQKCSLVGEDQSYLCSCEEGYVLNRDGRTCDDINECDKGTHRCDQKCDNSEGSYTCSCKPGYVLHPNGYTCEDINECDCPSDQGCGGCQQNCVNTVGSYHCSCRSEFVPLFPDATQCVRPYSEEDPCTKSKCMTMMYSVCSRNGWDNTECVCKDGYYLNSDASGCMMEHCDTDPCPPGNICEEQEDGRLCRPDESLGAVSGHHSDSSSGFFSGNIMIITITVGVVVLWFIIMTIVIFFIKRRRARKKPRSDGFSTLRRYPDIPSVVPVDRNSNMLENPIYHTTAAPYTASAYQSEHEYEDPEKLRHREMKFATNSYDQGINTLLGYDEEGEGEEYSYARTAGPPPPIHPPPVPPTITAPEYV